MSVDEANVEITEVDKIIQSSDQPRIATRAYSKKTNKPIKVISEAVNANKKQKEPKKSPILRFVDSLINLPRKNIRKRRIITSSSSDSDTEKNKKSKGNKTKSENILENRSKINNKLYELENLRTIRENYSQERNTRCKTPQEIQEDNELRDTTFLSISDNENIAAGGISPMSINDTSISNGFFEHINLQEVINNAPKFVNQSANQAKTGAKPKVVLPRTVSQLEKQITEQAEKLKEVELLQNENRDKISKMNNTNTNISEPLRQSIVDSVLAEENSNNSQESVFDRVSNSNKRYSLNIPNKPQDIASNIPRITNNNHRHSLNINNNETQLNNNSHHKKRNTTVSQTSTSTNNLSTPSLSDLMAQIQRLQLDNQRLNRLFQTQVNNQNQDQIQDQEFNHEQRQPQNEQRFEQNNGIMLKDALRNIDRFSGNPNELDVFLTNCDFYHEIIPDFQLQTLLNYIKTRLSSTVVTKLEALENFNSWEELREELLKKIKPLVTMENAMGTLHSMKQKANENVAQFGARIKNQVEILNNTKEILNADIYTKRGMRKLNEKTAMNQFTRGLINTQLYSQTNAIERDSLDDFIAFAAEKEISVKNSNHLRCNLCSKPGHLEFECHSKSKNDRTSNNNTEERKIITCYKCEKKGHYARDCRIDSKGNNRFQNDNQNRNYNDKRNNSNYRQQESSRNNETNYNRSNNSNYNRGNNSNYNRGNDLNRSNDSNYNRGNDGNRFNQNNKFSNDRCNVYNMRHNQNGYGQNQNFNYNPSMNRNFDPYQNQNYMEQIPFMQQTNMQLPRQQINQEIKNEENNNPQSIPAQFIRRANLNEKW